MATTQTDTTGKDLHPKGHAQPKPRKGVHGGHKNTPRAGSKQDHAHKTQPLTEEQKWNQRFTGYLKDPNADNYDVLIKQIVEDYNKEFASTPKYVPLDWRWVKAMVWDESGPNSHQDKHSHVWIASSAWRRYPLQIGNKGDPALDVVKGGTENTNLFASQEFRRELKKGPMTPELNIRAGIVYLYSRAVLTKWNPAVIDSQELQFHTVAPNETFASIARSEGTTSEEIARENPTIDPKKLKLKTLLKFKKAHGAFEIAGWDDWQNAIKHYNGETKDKKYRKKVNAAYKVIITKSL